MHARGCVPCWCVLFSKKRIFSGISMGYRIETEVCVCSGLYGKRDRYLFIGVVVRCWFSWAYNAWRCGYNILEGIRKYYWYALQNINGQGKMFYGNLDSSSMSFPSIRSFIFSFFTRSSTTMPNLTCIIMVLVLTTSILDISEVILRFFCSRWLETWSYPSYAIYL